MSFKRNDVQEFIEWELGCLDLEQWPSFKSSLEQWSVTTSNIVRIQSCVNSDISSYFFKALQSFVQALHEIDNKKYAWSIVKLYYSVFYLLRCEILLSNHIIVRCGTLYYAKIDINEKMVSFKPKKKSGDHQLTIALAEKLYSELKLDDPILGNKINEENAYLWILQNRERVNYRMKDFPDPICDVALSHVNSYFTEKKLIELFKYYKANTDYSICFDTDHTLLSIPYKKLISIYKRISSTIENTHVSNQKRIEARNLLLDLGLTKGDILDLVQ